MLSSAKTSIFKVFLYRKGKNLAKNLMLKGEVLELGERRAGLGLKKFCWRGLLYWEASLCESV